MGVQVAGQAGSEQVKMDSFVPLPESDGTLLSHHALPDWPKMPAQSVDPRKPEAAELFLSRRGSTISCFCSTFHLRSVCPPKQQSPGRILPGSGDKLTNQVGPEHLSPAGSANPLLRVGTNEGPLRLARSEERTQSFL
ncbi:unnamed protein product [Protopolystoma xenopodis]|uniref:Uncharacterized protein n=1 Tax=Protopolystoma xenopodis TaxID=117903 RepID=A0A3S5A6L7_9PLAT|nr:unnamed protein product [Protopolystoma xenopodis]